MRRTPKGGTTGLVLKGVLVATVALTGLVWWTAASKVFNEKEKVISPTKSDQIETEDIDKSIPVPTPNVSYKKCSDEGEICTCAGIIRFGHGENWSLRKPCGDKTNYRCSTAAFGDPATGTRKSCQCLATDIGTVDLHKYVQCMPAYSAVEDSSTAASEKQTVKVKENPFKPGQKPDSKTGIMLQVEKMRAEPHVDPRAWRKQSDEKYPDWTKRPNPSESSCKFRNDAFEKLIFKAKIPERHTKTSPRLLCLIYTMSSRTDAMETIRETYGAECDGLLFMSTETNPSKQELAVHHVGDEAYNNMWQKSRSIWGYVGAMEADKENEIDHFDWFVIGGDDLYVVVDNLRTYLGSDEIKEASNNGEKPMFLGRRFLDFSKVIFNSGGAGYVLNRAALSVLFNNLDSSQCHPDMRHFSEDREVALCLKLNNIVPYDTKDSKHEERFMPFAPDLHYTYRAKNYPPTDWYKSYSIDLKEGLEAMSEQVVSFHYLKPPVMRRLHALLFHCKHDNSGYGFSFILFLFFYENCRLYYLYS